MRNSIRVATVAAAVALTGCVTTQYQRWAPEEAPVMNGPRVRVNFTPIETAFPCVADKIRAKKGPRPTIAVGDIKDYTGKYSQAEGSTITQGGALMVYSALGKLGSAVQVVERFDTRIAELELAYMDRRQLGDGGKHALNDGDGQSIVPWVPYYGGSILQSDYYIIGGITELNYNIQSGGFQAAINNIGAQKRTFTMNIGADLRIVDTESLRVIKTVSLQKQITGEEVGANIFRFFGDELFDINMGAKNQEPLQLGVRTVLEQATLELVGAVTGVFAPTCIYEASYTPEQRDAAAMRVAIAAANAQQPAPATQQSSPATPQSVPATQQPGPTASFRAGAADASETPVPAPAPAVNADDGSQARLPMPQNGAGGGSANFQVAFDFGGDSLGGRGMTVVERIVAEAAKGKVVDFEVIASDDESWAPQKRQELTNARVRAIVDALVQRGIQPSRITKTWEPSLSDTGINRDGAGFQIFAKLRISQR